MSSTTRRLTLGTLAALLVVAAGIVFARQPRPTDRVITIEAEKYAYTPGVVRVNKGDRITLRLKAKDVTHGFYLEGYDLDAKARPHMPSFWARKPSTGEDYRTVEQVAFTADREGKFRFRCSVTCGYMHPFMQGELIVEPNRLFPMSVLLSCGLTLMCLIAFARARPSAPDATREA